MSDNAKSNILGAVVRSVNPQDFTAWKPLWDGYNAFNWRNDETVLSNDVTEATWKRFFDPNEPVFGLVAELNGGLVGFGHYVIHRSTSRVEPTCYLADLFVLESVRGRGIGRSLIDAVYGQARSAGAYRVYWTTHPSNAAGRYLYDQVAQDSGLIVYAKNL